MSEADRRGSIGAVQPPGSNNEETRHQHLRLMGFAVSLALLVLLAPPWLTVWGDDRSAPTSLYSGIGLIEVFGGGSPLGGWGTALLLTYLVLILVGLLFPATTGAVLSAFAGIVVTIVIMLLEPNREDALSGLTYQVAFTGSPVVAVGVWLVAVVVALAGWSTRRSD
ncbi:hypothetical protein [Kribbella sp. NPDC048928]|uniref:hypothetical protein n=1 Tax=Kribbella sp. NPDC048928 TaxID=3364111 RepID=UPI003716B12A